MHDLVIRNGQVIDGSGAAARAADIAIDGETITEVGSDVGAGRREIDADGRIVTPGFVDAHTHTTPRRPGTPNSHLSLIHI